jgi:hypothetical protein
MFLILVAAHYCLNINSAAKSGAHATHGAGWGGGRSVIMEKGRERAKEKEINYESEIERLLRVSSPLKGVYVFK